MRSETPSHVLLVFFPSQGNINPSLRLAKILAAKGLFVTLFSTLHFGQTLKNAGSISDQPSPVGNGFLSFEFFDDGCPPDDPRFLNFHDYFPQLERSGRASLVQSLKNCQPVSCVVGNPFMPWVCDVADELQIPCAILWVQSCAVFSSYYHHFHKLAKFPSETEPICDVQLPRLPLFKHDEIPSFLHPTDFFQAFGKLILDQFRNLSLTFSVLMDTFHELERDAIDYMSSIVPIKPIGPLHRKQPSDDNAGGNSVSGDCLKADDCFEWLNSKPPQSVVYVSFGSVVHLTQEQVNEIAYGLRNSGFPFLWVLKPIAEEMIRNGQKPHVLPDGFLEKAAERAKILPWSQQQKILSHPSVGCFLTHCGWNSSVEAVSSGVPVVVFPQWGDQVTNAKFLVEAWGVGVRLSRGAAEKRLIRRDEVERCLREAMVGPKAEEMREKGLKWKREAEKAAADGGSDQCIEEFVEEIRKRSGNQSFSERKVAVYD